MFRMPWMRNETTQSARVTSRNQRADEEDARLEQEREPDVMWLVQGELSISYVFAVVITGTIQMTKAACPSPSSGTYGTHMEARRDWRIVRRESRQPSAALQVSDLLACQRLGRQSSALQGPCMRRSMRSLTLSTGRFVAITILPLSADSTAPISPFFAPPAVPTDPLWPSFSLPAATDEHPTRSYVHPQHAHLLAIFREFWRCFRVILVSVYTYGCPGDCWYPE
ncbi:hypothetical protein BJ138DRAFT_1163754 [Hygrophoropsis aurantiaca]|uniref:Uncharacterized protein n=1 Tax=Hygrophoropsis aurantiaca TaxID=72124 RepID=A0ACB7ZXJ0_9AGAM|nr:hypothetical protein BJ138DRAFT_1163754 [Hygrophoropsis aurantiaca]